MTTIVMCGDEASRPPTTMLDATVVVVQDLCTRLRHLADWVPADENHLVLVVHRARTDLGSIQAAVRRIGFDPLQVGLLYLDAVDACDLSAALAATVARSQHVGRVDPAQVKMLPPDRSSRRALLSIGKPRYVAGPRVDHAVCHASDGCRVCVETCPADALSVDAAAIAHDINACVSCGQCVTACPAGAVENPTASIARIEAEIRAAVVNAATPIGIRYRCRGATVAAEQGWCQIEVPCTSMLTPGWVLAPLALGAGAVDVVSCSAGGCSLRLDRTTTAVLADTATIADELGLRIDQPLQRPLASDVVSETPIFAPGATARLVQLLSPPNDEPWSAELVVADVGTVAVDPSTCTACERCTHVCPSGALASDDDAANVIISFDPRSCTGCASCLTACPEIERGAISLRRRIDVADLASGRRTVRDEPIATCEVCGAPVAPQEMLARIRAMLGDDADALSVIGRRCQRCRGR